ncbi:hypothetical protein Pfo_013032 [Paulownia fortunei]|nr:hypothetical protein Pfo_013032 [Paulownia fortunei]
MMTSPPELSFDCKPHVYSMLLKYFGEHTTEQTQKLEEFVARLEEERLKIDAFKRELPLCMQLLTNAMEASRQELQSHRTNQEASPVLEEFMPLKNTSSSELTENAANISADKANWMKSAQLWNQETEGTKPPQSPLVTFDPKEIDIELALNAKQRINGGGAFLPLSSKDRISSPKRPRLWDCKYNSDHRKARRCWSPDLHRRFVNALHMLGGTQVATPKQIRELMKVDGLTNDEVKSHLQKYRLHTRSPGPSPQAAVTGAAQLVVLGGIWVPPEYAAAAAAAAQGRAPAAALYGADAATTRKVSPLFCSAPPPVPQEIYHAIATPPPPPKNQLHHHPIHPHQFHVYSKPPLTQRNNSLESIQRSAADPPESIDEKSESSSWKADSVCGNGAKRPEVAFINASVVSLNI